MAPGLTATEVKALLNRRCDLVEKPECWSCDCLQGFLAQLELDATADVTSLTAPHKVPRDKMHGCLGCDPCPPGAAFADYIRRHRQAKNAS